MSFAFAAALESLWPGEMLGVTVGGVKVLLVNVEGSVHAFENRCAHQAAELSRGKLEGHVLTCHLHEWCYDARSGCGVNPSTARLRRFPVRIEGADVLVDVEGHDD